MGVPHSLLPALTCVPLPRSQCLLSGQPPPAIHQLLKALGFAESCIIRQRLSLGRLQAPVNVIPARKAKPGGFSRLRINSLLSGCQRHRGGGTQGTRHVRGSQGCTAPGCTAALHHPQPQSTSFMDGDDPAPSPGGGCRVAGSEQRVPGLARSPLGDFLASCHHPKFSWSCCLLFKPPPPKSSRPFFSAAHPSF